MTDEEILEETPTRSEILKKSVLVNARKLGELSLRPMTAETLSYLFQIENLFVQGMKGERIAPANANAVWSIAEFVYIHAGDPDEVADSVWEKDKFRSHVRAMLAGPLSSPVILHEALPVVEEMVTEYFAAQTEAKASGKTPKGMRMGKGSARHGKQATSR